MYKCTLICIFFYSFQIYIWPDESLRRNQFRNGQTIDIRFVITTETLSYNQKPCATTETLCFNRNLVLQPKLCASTETLCYNRNLVLQPKPCATTETLCYNRNLVHSLKLKVGNEGFKTRSIVNEAKFLVCKEVIRWKCDWKLKPTLREANIRL